MTNEMRLIEALKDCITAMKHGDPNEPTTSIAWSKTIQNAESVLASKPEQDTIAPPLPADNGWISVKDGFPEIGEYVLVVLGKDTILKGVLTPNGWSVMFSDGQNMEGSIRTVSHWQPLPPPPVEKLNQ